MFMMGGCSWFDDDLPEETQEGNTFGMKVNGTNWEIPTTDYKPVAAYYSNDKCLIVRAAKKNSTENIVLVANNIDRSGEFNINFRTSISTLGDSTRLSSNNDYPNSYTLLSETESVLNIAKFDTVTNVVSATFSMKLRNRSGESLEITNGRFDIDLIIYK